MTDQEKTPINASRSFAVADYLVFAGIGALCGAGLWLVGEDNIIAGNLKPQAAIALISLAATFTLLWRREQMPLRLGFIILQAVLLTALTWQSIEIFGEPSEDNLIFWMGVSAPLLGFLLAAFARASFRERRIFWPYKALWQSGASILADGVIAGAVGLAAIAFVALWGVAFKAFGMEWATKIVHSPAFLLPLGGASAMIAGGLARSNTRLGEAVRSILLIGCRIGLPLAAVFSLIFAVGLIFGGADSLEKVPLTPAGLLLALALMSELIFNGVYQDGASKPPKWLRLASWLALIILPVYTLAAAAALWMRVQDYGLTPWRMIALIALTLTAAYTVLLLTGLISEFFAKRFSGWMPPIAKLNTFMALVWIVVLVLMHTPLLDPIAVSAKNQETRLRNGQVSVEKFDFGYLYFKLGRPGKASIARLAALDDPQIQAGINRAKAASNYWDYKHPKNVVSGEPAPKGQALSQINSILARANMALSDSASFDYGMLAYGKGEAGQKAFDALAQWAEASDSDDSGQVRILRERVGQGIVAARLAKTMEGWQSALTAANAGQQTFAKDVQAIKHIAGQLGEMAAQDRAARALFEKRTRQAGNIPSAQAMLELLKASAFVDQMDAENLRRLKELLDDKVWFDPEKTGRFAEQNAWLIVLHANHDLDFQEAVLKEIEPRALAGTFDGRRYAHLYDSLARARGKPQRYGTKSICEEGRWVADVTEDPQNVDKRRAIMGLAPLAQTLSEENTRFGQCHQ